MQKRIVLIFAHPDDESFAMGGTIAKYTAQGADVSLIVATKGEAGKTADLCLPENLGAFREQELRKAAHVLGISDLHFLGYRDKEVPQAPPLEIAEKLVRLLRTLRPQVVITFGEDGGSGHRDHRAIHHFTKMAVKLAGEPIALDWGEPFVLPRLCYVQTGWRMSEEKRQLIDYTIPISEWADQKWRAVLEHQTQIFSRQKFENMAEPIKKDYFCREYFRCDHALSVFPGQGNDLFQGIEGKA